MNDLERRDFYSGISAGIGSFLLYFISILVNADAVVAGMASTVGALGGLMFFLKSIRLFEKFQGITWRRVEHG